MVQDKDIIRIDGIKWWISPSGTARIPVALCPQHHIRLTPKPDQFFSTSLRRLKDKDSSTANKMECAEGPHVLPIPREFSKQKMYVINRVDALVFAKMSVLNLDDEAIPVAKEEIGKDSPYWIKSKLTESKSGTRLIIWAGDRSKKNKTQLFIEPALKRLSFDHNDSHPLEVFAKVEVTFAEGVTSAIENKKEK